jgi:DNA-binding GntR family transcriptional regulator
VRDDVYDELKRRIVELDFKPGQVLHEKDLAEAFSVSRTPIREALIRLESDGLVRVSRGRGAYVTEVSLQNLKESFEIRSHLAALVGRLVVVRATEEEVAAMEELLARIESETEAAALRSLDMAFHDLVNAATHNAMLAETLTRMRNQVSRVWDTNIPAGEDHFFNGIHEEFSGLAAAVRAKDSDGVAEVLRCHLARLMDEIVGFSSPDRLGTGIG